MHSILIDGVYIEQGEDEPPLFVEAPRPTDKDIKRLTETVAGRILRMLVKRGVLDEASCAPDPLSEDEPVLAGLLQASVLDDAAVGERAGKRIRRVLQDPPTGQRTVDLCYAASGFTLHAARHIRAHQRGQLEELLRYVLRPPFANNRLTWLSEDELLLRLKSKWSDGTSHVLMSPIELIARLAALIPPRGFNSVRYHGVFSPGSKLRAKVIPTPPPPEASQSEELEPQPAPSTPARRPSRIPWAQLLRRVFRVDVETCGECGGRMKLMAFVTDAAEARRYLEHEGLPAEVPSIAMARAPPQVEMDFDEG